MDIQPTPSVPPNTSAAPLASTPIDQPKKNSLVKILFGIILLTGILAVSFAYGRVYLKNKEFLRQEELNKINALVLEQNLAEMNQFFAKSTIDEQNIFLEKVNKDLIKENLYDTTKNLLLLRKGLVISTVRGSDASSSNRNESTDIFKRFISNSATSTADLYIKDFSIAAFVRLHFQCCATRPFSEELPDLYNSFAKEGYDEKTSRLLTLSALTDQVSPERKDDATIIAYSMLTKAQLLDLYREKLHTEIYNQIINELKANIESYPEVKYKLFTDKNSIELENSLYYAYAHDLYFSLTSSGEENNKKIDGAYELAFEKLNTAPEQSDKISINMLKLFNAARYIRSLDRRYGENVDRNKKENLIKLVLETINSSPEVKKVADSYFKASLSGNSANMGYLVKLSKNNKSLADYMLSIGITQSDVSKLPY